MADRLSEVDRLRRGAGRAQRGPGRPNPDLAAHGHRPGRPRAGAARAARGGQGAVGHALPERDPAHHCRPPQPAGGFAHCAVALLDGDRQPVDAHGGGRRAPPRREPDRRRSTGRASLQRGAALRPQPGVDPTARCLAPAVLRWLQAWPVCRAGGHADDGARPAHRRAVGRRGRRPRHGPAAASAAWLESFAYFAATAVENARLYGEVADKRRELEAVLAGIGDGVLVADTAGALVLMNPVAARIFGAGGAAGGAPLRSLLPAGELGGAAGGDRGQPAGADPRACPSPAAGLQQRRPAAHLPGAGRAPLPRHRDRRAGGRRGHGAARHHGPEGIGAHEVQLPLGGVATS